jgi:hypothetical protein
MNQQSAMQQNMQARAIALTAYPEFRQKVATETGSIGGTTRIKLKNVGLTTRLILRLYATYTVATATPTVSPKAPYNLASRITLVDYDGTQRVNVSGFMLFLLNSCRSRKPFGWNNEGAAVLETLPKAENAVGAGKIGECFLEIPLAFDHSSDLRGAILSQTSVGEAYLNIDWNSATNLIGSDADGYFSAAGGGSVSGVTLTAEVWQEGYLPQQLGQSGVILPLLDLATVYELNGMLKVTDLTASTERLINYPNNRTVIGEHFLLQNNGALTASDLSQIRQIVNGNNILKDFTYKDKLHDQRQWLGGDAKAGYWFMLSRQKPIETALFGNVQTGFTPSAFTAGASSYLEVCHESFYVKGSALPGVSQG